LSDTEEKDDEIVRKRTHTKP